MYILEMMGRFIMTNANEYLRSLYLDYLNNYLSVERFAEHNGLDIDQADVLLDIGRALHEDYVASLKSIKTFKRIRKVKSLVDQGIPVYDSNDGYRVYKDSLGQYLITFDGNGYTTGLTSRDNMVLNASDLYYYINGERVNL